MEQSHEPHEQEEKQAATAPTRALVPSTRQEMKSMVVAAVTSAITEARQNIGVSVNWLVKHVAHLALSPQEVETLVSVRTQFGGSLPHAVKFLYQGLTAEDVYGCYRTQRALAEMSDEKESNVSVTKIVKLTQAFAEADPEDEELEEMILKAHEVIKERYFWVRYVMQTIDILCAIAEEYGCATIDAALALVDSRHPKESGVLPDDEGEEDEVERHRLEYETRRKSLGG